MSNLIRYGVPRWRANPVTRKPFAAGPPTLLPDTSGVYAAAVLADTPIWWSRLSAVPLMIDASGNARHGSYGPAVTKGVAGALAGDTDPAITTSGGATSTGDVPYAAWMNGLTALSMECWIKFTSTGTQMMFSRTGNTLFNYGLSCNSAERAQFNVKAGSGSLATVGTRVLSDGLWHHLVGTYDGSLIRLYVDGVLEGTPTAQTGTVDSATNGLQVGGRGANYYTGSVDEPALYGTALSAARVLAHYQAGIGGAIVTGTASGTQAGTGTAVATVKVPATAVGAQAGTGTAAAKVKVPATAAGTQAGTGTAVAIRKFTGTAAGTQAGTGSAIGTPKVLATAAGTQAGSAAAAGSVSTPSGNVTGSASGTQAGTGTVTAVRTTWGTASSSSAGAGTAAGLVKVPGTAAATNAGTGSAIAIHTVYATAIGVQAGTGSALQSGYINHHGRVPYPDPEPRVTIDAAEARVPVDPAEARIPIP